ncbi:helix-turn-helix domain-containing protein [Anaerocolumna sp.]|uniref:helix-turn-helix domain-containing protein n=1 Tax=Anaerocolumna sp. TaxID=2041569 RepID=UPI0028AB5F09|nr:helix-turn-helix domain-containing protein [Anaerocolumna sp.]
MSRQRSLEKIAVSEYVTIGELVRLTGSRYSTLKFYTEEGMLPFEQEEENLTRRFPREKTVARITEIQELKRRGYSIPEIKKRLQQV